MATTLLEISGCKLVTTLRSGLVPAALCATPSTFQVTLVCPAAEFAGSGTGDGCHSVYETNCDSTQFARYYISPTRIPEYFATLARVLSEGTLDYPAETIGLELFQGPPSIDGDGQETKTPVYYELTWKKTPKSAPFSQTLGQIYLPLVPNTSAALSRVFNAIYESYKYNTLLLVELRRQSSESKQNAEKLQTELVKFAKDAREREDEMMLKFVEILNSKKEMIANLQRTAGFPSEDIPSTSVPVGGIPPALASPNAVPMGVLSRPNLTNNMRSGNNLRRKLVMQEAPIRDDAVDDSETARQN